MVREIEIVRVPVSRRDCQKMVQTIDSARSGYLSPPACLDVEVLANSQRDEVVVIITWASAKDHDESLHGSLCAAFFKEVSALAAGAAEAVRYEPAAIDSK